MDETADLGAQVMFGHRLRELRLGRGLSQMRLAFDAGLDHTYVSDAERGKRNVTLRNIHRLARALGVQPYELLQPPAVEPPSSEAG